MAEHPNVEAARASLEALAKGDVETMSAGIAPDAVWHVPGSNQWSGDFTGKDTIMGRFARMSEQGYRISLDEIHDIVGGDDHVVALVRVSAQGPSGSASTNSVWVMHVRDGMATEFWGHNVDQEAVDRVLG
jgi:hypothetical protein